VNVTSVAPPNVDVGLNTWKLLLRTPIETRAKDPNKSASRGQKSSIKLSEDAQQALGMMSNNSLARKKDIVRQTSSFAFVGPFAIIKMNNLINRLYVCINIRQTMKW